MKKNVFLLFMLLASMAMVARDCPKCNGKGRIKTPGVSGFGIDPYRRTVCSRCGKTYNPSDNHWCDCDMCNGTGSVSDSRSSGGSEVSDFESDLVAYLTPEEYNALQETIRLMQGYLENIPCSACDGSGECNQCGGVMNLDFDNPNRCLFCGGSGVCAVCNGRCIQGSRVVEPTEEQRERMAETVASFFELAKKRKDEKWGALNACAEADLAVEDAAVEEAAESYPKAEYATIDTAMEEMKALSLSAAPTKEESDSYGWMAVALAALILGCLGFKRVYKSTKRHGNSH